MYSEVTALIFVVSYGIMWATMTPRSCHRPSPRHGCAALTLLIGRLSIEWPWINPCSSKIERLPAVHPPILPSAMSELHVKHAREVERSHYGGG